MAHERLITAWPRLAGIVADRRDDLLMQARLERQAADWKDGHGALIGRDAATDAHAWLAGRSGSETSHTVSEYVFASWTALRRRRAVAAGVLSVIVALALTASAIAAIAVIQRSNVVKQSHVAQSEEKTAQSEAMAAEATSLLPVDAPLAMLLSLQAYERAPILQATSALIEAGQQPLDELLTAGSTVDAVAFSPDGRTLAAGDDDGNVGLWHVATGRKTATLNDSNPVDSVAFSPDGRTLVTGDFLGNVNFWNTDDGQLFASLSEADGGVDGLAFSLSDQVLAIGGLNGSIVFLRQNLTDLNRQFFTHLICGKVRGNITRAQWAEYAPGQPYQKTCP